MIPVLPCAQITAKSKQGGVASQLLKARRDGARSLSRSCAAASVQRKVQRVLRDQPSFRESRTGSVLEGPPDCESPNGCVACWKADKPHIIPKPLWLGWHALWHCRQRNCQQRLHDCPCRQSCLLPSVVLQETMCKGFSNAVLYHSCGPQQ